LRAAYALQCRRAMKNLILIALLGMAACKSKSKCDQVVDHTLELMPDDFKKGMDTDAGREKAIGKCEAASDEAKQCALDAKSMDDLMKCPRK